MLSIAHIVEHSDTFATDTFGTLHGIGITMIGPEVVVPYYTVSHEYRNLCEKSLSVLCIELQLSTPICLPFIIEVYHDTELSV